MHCVCVCLHVPCFFCRRWIVFFLCAQDSFQLNCKQMKSSLQFYANTIDVLTRSITIWCMLTTDTSRLECQSKCDEIQLSGRARENEIETKVRWEWNVWLTMEFHWLKLSSSNVRRWDKTIKFDIISIEKIETDDEKYKITKPLTCKHSSSNE